MKKYLLSVFPFFVLANGECNAQNLPEPPKGFKWVKVEKLSDEFDSWDQSKCIQHS